jgi:hypothetical protein
MSIGAGLTFKYQFNVKAEIQHVSPEVLCWAGEGAGRGYSGRTEGIVGPKPRFELRAGWLSLFPTGGWIRSLPTRWFSDAEHPPRGTDRAAHAAAIKAQGAEWLEAQKESQNEVGSAGAWEDFNAYIKATNDAMGRALERRGLRRSLASYAVFVGESLGRVLRIGDEVQFSRDGSGDFQYRVLRNSEMMLSAGSVGRVDEGEPIAIWQEYDHDPNPYTEAGRKTSFNMRVGSIDEHKPYVSVRVKGKMFHLLDGQEVHVDPYFVFLARSNKNVPALAFEFTPRAVHSAGRLDALAMELIIDAARQLTTPRTRIL